MQHEQLVGLRGHGRLCQPIDWYGLPRLLLHQPADHRACLLFHAAAFALLTSCGVQAAYKNYVSVFVGRYVDEPGILAWELANEPRCAGYTG